MPVLVLDVLRVTLPPSRCRPAAQVFGTVVVIPVGATMVGSIHFTAPMNEPLRKGAELGYFSFGGSTVIVLFERGMTGGGCGVDGPAR